MKNVILFNLILCLIICCSSATALLGQENKQSNLSSWRGVTKDNKLRHSIGSSLFLLGNIGDSVNFIQFNYGYHITPKDQFIAEVITWTYYEPLVTYGSSEKYYPGKVKANGLGLGYQRFLWKNLYSTFEPTFFLQQFYDSEENKIQKGFQLYLQFIVGYRFEFMQKRLFIEPAVAFKYWPINTNFPTSFAVIEKGKPKYKFEPGLNFGISF